MQRLAFLLLCLIGIASPAKAASVDLDAAFKGIAFVYDLPEDLLRAICYKESNYDVLAYNHGDGGRTVHAFGVCQLLSSTAREVSLFEDTRCRGDFRDRTSRSKEACVLFDEVTNISIAAAYLKQLLDRYGGNVYNAIAAYNAGGLYVCKDGTMKLAKGTTAPCETGKIINHKYVEEVLRIRKQIRQNTPLDARSDGS